MRVRLAIALLLVALVVAVFAQVRHHDFVNYDDRIYVVENPLLQSGSAGLWRAFRPYETNWIPLTWISLQLDHAVHGMRPAGFLATNVALHAASAVLLFLALARMTRSVGPSAFVAAVFAVHPLHVESVAWVSERKDTLSGLFFMLSLLAWARYAERPGVSRYALVAACFALGLLAKPMLVTLPFVLLLLDDWPLGRLREAPGARLDRARTTRALLEKLPLLALAAAAAAITFLVQRERGAMAGEDALSLAARLANAAEAYVTYLGQSVWPAGLATFYPHPGEAWPAWRPVAAGLLLLAITAAALRAARRRPWLGVGWLWYAGMLVPVSGLVQVGLQAHADRYTYLPSIGLSIAVAWGARDWLGRSPRARAALGLAGAAAVGALAAAAWVQVGYWKDTSTLFARAIAVTQDNYLAQQAFATTLLHDGQAAEAEPHFAEALRIKPRWPAAQFGLGDALAAQGELDRALEHYEAGLRLAPRHANGRAQYGQALADAGRHEEAIHQYLRALRNVRGSRAARVHALLARSLTARGDLAGALEHYARALEIDPGYAEVHANLGAALLQAGRPQEAQAALARAAELGVESAELQLALAEAAQARGSSAEAARHYREALRLEPGSLAAANNLGWLLATDADPEVRDPEAAVRLVSALADGRAAGEPALLDTLAAGYAAAGRFDDAVEVAERAAALAEGRGELELAADIRERRRLYAAGRPYVEPVRPAAAP